MILVAGWLCCLAPKPAFAALQAYVDQNPVPANQSFTLTLQSDGAGGSPDLAGLKKDFDVLNQSQSSTFQDVNGATSQQIQWQISLMARRPGHLVIPSISVGSQKSPPIALTVTTGARSSGGQPKGLFLDVQADPRNPYVQAQVHYTVRLYHAVDLGSGATLSEPSLASGGAIVERLGKAREYETTRNGIRYDVVERDYALYPQRSGKLVIPPVVFDGDVVEGGGGFFGLDPFNASTHYLRVRSPAVTLDVRPQPPGFRGGEWLPARSLRLEQRWSQSPSTFTVGQPITRTLTVTANGLTAAQLPGLEAPIPGLKEYPDQPRLQDEKDSQGVTGVRRETVAMIPTHAGRTTLPEVEVPWWNTVADRMETARIPEQTLMVAPAPGTSASPRAELPSAAALLAASAPVASPGHPPSGPWRWIALLAGLGWLGTILAWGWMARRPKPERLRNAAEPSQGHLERDLEASCLANDAAQARTLLLAWARHRWPEDPPASLTRLARRCSPGLAQALEQLDRALYAPSGDPWQGGELWKRFSSQKTTGPGARKVDSLDLEPLYPDKAPTA